MSRLPSERKSFFDLLPMLILDRLSGFESQSNPVTFLRLEHLKQLEFVMENAATVQKV